MYKIIKDNRVIDLVQYADFIRFLSTGRAIRTSKDFAEGIVGADNKTIYSFQPNTAHPVVTVEEISCDEFKRLQSLLNSGVEICANEVVLAEARQSKIMQLSNQCKVFINAGFSTTLSDGKLYNFRLTAEDQLNLMSIEGQLNMGAETAIYHATDMPCRVFTRDDMLKVVKAFRRHVTYHTTYFNVAKQYINSLTDTEKISRFSYGTDVSTAVNDRVIRQILKNGADLL